MQMNGWPGLLAGLVLCCTLQTRGLHGAEAMTIDSAIEALADEDLATREKAEAFLRAQGEAAIPALKKALEGNDPEIRKRANALLTIAKRLGIGVKITDMQDKPVAGTEFKVVVLRAEDGTRVWAGGGQVELNGLKPVLEATLKTDAEGVLMTGELNQDSYAICLSCGEEFPPQSTKLNVTVTDEAKPAVWQIRRGAEVKIKVVDEKDQPVADAAILFNERWGDFSTRELNNMSDRKLAKRLENLPADSKTNAAGEIAFKKLMEVPPSLTVFHAGYARELKTGLKVVDGQTNDFGVIKLQALKKSTVAITVVDGAKKPLKGVTVVIVDIENRHSLSGYVEQNQLAKVLEYKYAQKAGPSDDQGRATVALEPGRYAFAVANGESSHLSWMATVENGVDLNCGTVVLP